MPDPTTAALARAIAEALGETNPHLVRRVVEVLGPAIASAHYTEALRIEAAGGELISSGKRRRTPGGVFFRLVRSATTGPWAGLPARTRRNRPSRALNAPTARSGSQRCPGIPAWPTSRIYSHRRELSTWLSSP